MKCSKNISYEDIKHDGDMLLMVALRVGSYVENNLDAVENNLDTTFHEISESRGLDRDLLVKMAKRTFLVICQYIYKERMASEVNSDKSNEIKVTVTERMLDECGYGKCPPFEWG